LQYVAPDARIYDPHDEYDPEEEEDAAPQRGDADAGMDGAQDMAAAAGGGGVTAAEAAERRRRRDLAETRAQGGGEGLTGLLLDISTLLVGFFTSLVPRTPPEPNFF
jgi:hypothetical protein